jgi:hypothetical protein
MRKLPLRIAACVVYETFTVAALASCPLPRQEICATSPKDCREDQHIEREMTTNVSTSAVYIVQMSVGGPIMPGSGVPAFITTTPQQYTDTPQPFISRPSA